MFSQHFKTTKYSFFSMVQRIKKFLSKQLRVGTQVGKEKKTERDWEVKLHSQLLLLPCFFTCVCSVYFPVNIL